MHNNTYPEANDLRFDTIDIWGLTRDIFSVTVDGDGINPSQIERNPANKV